MRFIGGLITLVFFAFTLPAVGCSDDSQVDEETSTENNADGCEPFSCDASYSGPFVQFEFFEPGGAEF